MTYETSDKVPPLIQRAGEAIWGPQWQPAMATALRVRIDTVKRWRLGRIVPGTVWEELSGIADRRVNLISTILPQLSLAANFAVSIREEDLRTCVKNSSKGR